MVIALVTTVEILLQLCGMDEFIAVRAFYPAAKAIFLCRLNFNFRLMSRK